MYSLGKWLPGVIMLLICSSCIQDSRNLGFAGPAPDLPHDQLIWQDEFEYHGLPDSSLWSYDIGDACDQPAGCGWGNNELQYYTASRTQNARVEKGDLIIEAHLENFNNRKFTSARLHTRNLHHIKYGKIDVRAKLPYGRGTWAAIWLLPVDNVYGGWPQSGEMDVMEYVGYIPDSIFGTIHTQDFNGIVGTQVTNNMFIPDAYNDYHIYSLEWEENQLRWYVDNVLYHSYLKSSEDHGEWPFDQEFYLIVNLAVGGNWGGKEGVDESIFPQQFVIDYVRIFENASSIK